MTDSEPYERAHTVRQTAANGPQGATDSGPRKVGRALDTKYRYKVSMGKKYRHKVSSPRGKRDFPPNRENSFPLFIRQTSLSFKVFAGIGFSLDAPGGSEHDRGAHNRVSHSTEIETSNALERGGSK